MYQMSDAEKLARGMQFPSTKTDWATAVASAVAKYGTGLVIKNLTAGLIYHGKTHQKIAVAVATYVVYVAIKDKVGELAAKLMVEFIELGKVAIDLYKQLTSQKG